VSQPICAACHNTLDPYGLAFENFDPFGKWRSLYANIPGTPLVDPSGTLMTGESFTTEQQFMSILTTSPNTLSCVTKKIMAAGLTRSVSSSSDTCVAAAISASAMTPTSKFSELISSIVTSPQFQMQQTESQ